MAHRNRTGGDAVTAELFPDVPRTPEPEPEPQLSPDRRRTIRRRQLLEQGVHPTTRRPLLRLTLPDNPATCATCDHVTSWRLARTYWKCQRAPGGLTGGPATDVRLSWPACDLWEPAGDE